MARIAAFAIGAIAIVIAILGGEGLNVSFMVGLAFAVAASANFPALLLALTWRRFNTTGAVAGVLTGVISSIGLIVISPTVWPGPDAEGGACPGTRWRTRASCRSRWASWPATWARCCRTESGAERSFDELYVRSETGLGAEQAGPGASLRGAAPAAPEPAGAR